MSDCLHCDINELVQQRIERGENLGELAAMIVECLAELILLAPEAEQSKLMADTLAQFGHTFLERGGEEASSARH